MVSKIKYSIFEDPQSNAHPLYIELFYKICEQVYRF